MFTYWVRYIDEDGILNSENWTADILAEEINRQTVQILEVIRADQLPE